MKTVYRIGIALIILSYFPLIMVNQLTEYKEIVSIIGIGLIIYGLLIFIFLSANGRYWKGQKELDKLIEEYREDGLYLKKLNDAIKKVALEKAGITNEEIEKKLNE